MAKTAPLAEISLKYVELSEAQRSRAVTVVFIFRELQVKNLLLCPL